MSPDQVRRSFARSVKKMSCGRGGLPDHVVSLMWDDYKRLNSLAKVGALHNRTRQSVFSLFVGRGFELNKKKFQSAVIYNGRKYTPSKNGYLRDTVYRGGVKGEEKQLHRIMWADLHGPIPAGHQVSLKDGDKTNVTPQNLFCLPIREVTLFHYRRRFGGRAALTPEQRYEWWKAFYRRYAANRSAAFKARGLRCDGKQLRRNKNGALNPARKSEWKFNYFPPVIVSENQNQKVLRRKVASFSAEKSRFDLDYEKFRSEMQSEKPQDIYA
ncbi:MAG TPA: HNH endonuclease signature motif containing protein [Verrucomicrobiae bacterium]|nr:HNH endonuclease signature motif containing protein [Verrucomicrobiae bacterium]